ncbi:MAG: hypothetical protein QOJ05_491 [Verrucomicrobiota bacterium]
MTKETSLPGFGSNLLKTGRALAIMFLMGGGILMGQQPEVVEPQQLLFKDDGAIPNNRLPLLLYRQAFAAGTADLASAIELRFAENNWTGSWRAGIYPFRHYHSTTHEVLGVFAGSATLRLGGGQGATVRVRTGDVIVIPAGVGHQKLQSSADFSVVGAYPDGRRWDLLRGLPGERPEADRNIAAVPLPKADPVYGSTGPLNRIWQSR